jgi:toxin ParE1/3/4
MPGRGRVGLKEGTREILFHPLPYILVYRLKDDVIEILRIYHGAQDRTEH